MACGYVTMVAGGVRAGNLEKLVEWRNFSSINIRSCRYADHRRNIDFREMQQ